MSNIVVIEADTSTMQTLPADQTTESGCGKWHNMLFCQKTFNNNE